MSGCIKRVHPLVSDLYTMCMMVDGIIIHQTVTLSHSVIFLLEKWLVLRQIHFEQGSERKTFGTVYFTMEEN